MRHSNKLFNKDFLLLWQGQLVSLIGSQATTIAILFWIKHTTNSGSLMGALLMASLIPAVIFGPFGGTFADHFHRKKIIIACDLMSGLAVLSLAAMMFFLPEANSTILIGTFIASVILSLVKAFFAPAITAAIPDIVSKKHITSANSAIQGSMQLSTFIGQGIGGILFRILGAPLLLLIDGISYLFSAFAASFISMPFHGKKSSKGWKQVLGGFKQDTREGMVFINTYPGMKFTFIYLALLNFFFAPVLVLLPFYVEDFLQAKTDWYGYLLAMFSIGSIIGYGLASGIKTEGKSRSKVVFAFFLAVSASIALLGLVKVGTIALVVITLIGIFIGFININMMSLLQIHTPSDMRGRVFGILTTMTSAIMPVSMGLTGFILDLLNKRVEIMLIACGVILLCLSGLLIFNKSFFQFFATKVEEEEKVILPELEEAALIAQ